MEAAMVAINTINAETIANGKTYELVNLEKFVLAEENRSFLLTLTVAELIKVGGDVVMVDADADADTVLKTIRAFVYSPMDHYKLLEWKFKS